MEEKTIKKQIIDDNGDRMEIEISSCNPYQVNMGKGNYKIASEMRPKTKSLVRKRNTFNSDIGIKSGGFAQVATLAAILAIAGAVIAYLFFEVLEKILN